MRRLHIHYRGGLELEMAGPERTERLQISGDYPTSSVATFCFTHFGLMHLVAPYLPREISTDFNVCTHIQDLIAAMYRSEDKRRPQFVNTQRSHGWSERLPKTDPRRVVIAYSGGKDSMWNLSWAEKEFGPQNILLVHIHGLNKANGARELEYATLQSATLGFPLEVVRLADGSGNHGFAVMRTHVMFLAGLCLPVALRFGASKIIMEGFAESGPEEYFGGQEQNAQYLNRIFRDLGVEVKVLWRNRLEMDVVKDLVLERPGWLPSCVIVFPHRIIVSTSEHRGKKMRRHSRSSRHNADRV